MGSGDKHLARAQSLADSVSRGAKPEARLLEWTSGSNTSEDAGDQSFLDSLGDIARVAAVHRAAGIHPGAPPSDVASPSERWGHLELIEKLGTGSAGVLYRARDSKLGHEVALKLFHRENIGAEDKDAFLSEGRRHVLVKHNNVVQIHGAGEHDGRVGMWMELIEGQTLYELCAQQGCLGASEAANVGIEICRAIAAVHQAGLIHGDIKAENVMRERGGRIVVMDFSTSRLRGERERHDRTSGTPLYMSPEVFAGEGPSPLSDIYGIGVLLYYLVTAEYPYHGKNLDELRENLARGEPRLLKDVRPELPGDFGQIVLRAISTNPQDRFRSVGAMEEALARSSGQSTGRVSPSIRRTSDAGYRRRAAPLSELPSKDWDSPETIKPTPAGIQTGRETEAKARPIGVALTLLVLVAGIVAYSVLVPDRFVPPFSNPVQVSSSIGVEDSPAWSPDGRTLAYDAIRSGDLFGGNWDIWVAQIGAGQPVNRTSDHDGTDRFPSWSPDGNEIAFWSSRDGGGYFVMSPLAGAPRKVALAGQAVWPRGPSRPQWSADGAELAYVTYESAGAFVEIVSLRSGDVRRLPLPGKEGNGRFELSWSPDERFFAYVDAADPAVDITQLWVLHVGSGQASAVSDGQTNDWSPSWSADGRSLYLVSDRGGVMDLWRQPVADDGTPEGPAQQITTGQGLRHAEFSSDETKLAYSKGRRVANIWRVPILADRPATWGERYPTNVRRSADRVRGHIAGRRARAAELRAQASKPTEERSA